MKKAFAFLVSAIIFAQVYLFMIGVSMIMGLIGYGNIFNVAASVLVANLAVKKFWGNKDEPARYVWKDSEHEKTNHSADRVAS